MKFIGSFGVWLKERRKALDLTQRDLADQVGCAEITIRKIEGDVLRPSKQITERMADVLAIAGEERAAFVRFARRLGDKPPAVPAESDTRQPAHNLPSPLTPLIGREQELAQIAGLLADANCRLLTLLGPGGIGKTRLALQAAADRIEDFADGVYFVPLTPVGSASGIDLAIANTLQFSFYGQDAPTVQVVNYLHSKHLLLLMDNFEHLLAGVGLLTDILTKAPHVKILVTSRERLNVQEEWAFPVDGLLFPSQYMTGVMDSYSAVQLFVQSARRIEPGFKLEDNQRAVIAICQAVEGMPLALELAASWLRAMTCDQIAEHIRHDLDFLARPLRNVPERHRNLRALFDHSWALLSSPERHVLMRLSVFRGGWDAEAAEQVVGADLPMLAGLVDKSLIRLHPTGRYDMHELMRQYVANQLRDAGEENATHQSHYNYFLKLAEGANAHAFGREQIAWFDRIEVDLDNLRAAFAWSKEVEAGLRLAAALGWFLSERAHWSEGLEWLAQTFAANPNAPAFLKAQALHSMGALAGLLGDAPRARMYCEQALALARAANDRWNIAWSLSHLALNTDSEPESVPLLEESLSLFRELGDRMGVSHTLVRLSMCVISLVDYRYARLLLEEAATCAKEAGDKVISAWATHFLGMLSWFQDNDLKQARIHFESSLALFREARFGLINSVVFLADVERAIGSVVRAQKLYEEALKFHRERALNNPHVPYILAGLASIASTRGQFERAAKLLSAAGNSSHLIRFANRRTYKNISFYNDVAMVRARLGETAFAEAWATGQTMHLEQCINYALEGSTTPIEMNSTEQAWETAAPASQSMTEPLSNRELEVLRLVADGLSNREIAARLILAPTTVKWYLSEIYGKLGVANRIQAGIRARELNLLN